MKSCFFYYDLSDRKLDFEKMESLLSPAVLSHCKRYKREEDYRNSLFAWSFVFQHLHLPKDTKLSFNPYHKPILKGIEFNLSHSKDYIAVVFSSSPCGIDIQYVDEKKDFSLMAEKVLTKNEYQSFLESDDKPLSFIRCWTHKEAYYKRIGKGIDLHQLKDGFLDSSWISKELLDSNGCRYILTVSAEQIDIPASLH